jgi:hypothetical protein
MGVAEAPKTHAVHEKLAKGPGKVGALVFVMVLLGGLLYIGADRAGFGRRGVGEPVRLAMVDGTQPSAGLGANTADGDDAPGVPVWGFRTCSPEISELQR